MPKKKRLSSLLRKPSITHACVSAPGASMTFEQNANSYCAAACPAIAKLFPPGDGRYTRC